MKKTLTALAVIAALSSPALAQAPAAPTYTVATTKIGELLDHPALKAIFVKYLPDLANNDRINEGRDLTVTTDFRRVLGEAAYKTLGAKNMEAVFPGAQVTPSEFLNFV